MVTSSSCWPSWDWMQTSYTASFFFTTFVIVSIDLFSQYKGGLPKWSASVDEMNELPAPVSNNIRNFLPPTTPTSVGWIVSLTVCWWRRNLESRMSTGELVSMVFSSCEWSGLELFVELSSLWPEPPWLQLQMVVDLHDTHLISFSEIFEWSRLSFFSSQLFFRFFDDRWEDRSCVFSFEWWDFSDLNDDAGLSDFSNRGGSGSERTSLVDISDTSESFSYRRRLSNPDPKDFTRFFDCSLSNPDPKDFTRSFDCSDPEDDSVEISGFRLMNTLRDSNSLSKFQS